MLHRWSQMRVALHAKAGNKGNRRAGRLGERVGLAAAHGGDDGHGVVFRALASRRLDADRDGGAGDDRGIVVLRVGNIEPPLTALTLTLPTARSS